MPLRLRLFGLAASAIIGLGSKAAEGATDPGSARNFAIAAIISAGGAAGVGLIGAITNMIVKLRRVEHTRPRPRAKTRSQLLREQARLERQLAELDEEETS